MQELINMITFMTAGAFVYLAFQLKGTFGDTTYYTLVAMCLGVGYLLRR